MEREAVHNFHDRKVRRTDTTTQSVRTVGDAKAKYCAERGRRMGRGVAVWTGDEVVLWIRGRKKGKGEGEGSYCAKAVRCVNSRDFSSVLNWAFSFLLPTT